jgi:hypothetical protein
MSTDRATETLAEIYRTGDADSREERRAEGHLWSAVERAEACDWGRADYSLEAAYHPLGAEPPDASANDLGLGSHPIQVEAGRRYREEMGEV